MQKYQNTLLQEGGETLLSSDFSAVSRTRTTVRTAAFILSSTIILLLVILSCHIQSWLFWIDK